VHRIGEQILENVMLRRAVSIPTGAVTLDGELTLPPHPSAVVLFAHGSGSSRTSPRNRFVADELAAGGFATLLFDLFTLEEEQEDALSGRMRFDVALLANRLVGATKWIELHEDTPHLPVGYFGASTGAAAALLAATVVPESIFAIVSRGGRPDLAEGSLDLVRAPTLLIVGGADTEVLALNREAFAELRVEKKLEIVPEATHLFEEPGALPHVAHLAKRWFEWHAPPAHHPHGPGAHGQP
jgi:dienelactone hydrolase